MTASLPTDFLSRVRQVLNPFISTKEEREAMIIEAFFRYDPIVSHVDLEGSPKVFCARFVNQLIDHCISEEQHALARLLESLRADCGVNKHSEIDDLIAVTNALCVQSKPKPVLKLSPVSSEESLQSIATPPDERTPTVFISYSHDDETFTQQLIADLNAAGHACWIDTTKIKGGDEWIMTIAEGIINSYAFVPILSHQAMASSWVRKEVLWAVDRKKLILPLFMDNVFDHPFFFLLKDIQGMTLFDTPYPAVFRKLLSDLPAPALPEVQVSEEEAESGEISESIAIERRSVPRKLELAYLERLRLEELLSTEKYTALGGTAQVQGQAEMRAVFELIRVGKKDQEALQTETRTFENAVDEIKALRRCVLLGEPGGGKTTTIWKLAADLVNTALQDRDAPIPLLIRLGKWTDADQTLPDFMASQLGDLGKHLSTLLTEKRAALLLDGLNELPASQHKAKYAQVQQFIEQHPDLLAVVSCRELDYTLDLGFDKITITPLDPLRIREFVGHYLNTVEDPHKGDVLFWKLAGKRAKEYLQMYYKDGGISQKMFWVDKTAPNIERGWHEDDNHIWQNWLKEREKPSGLMILARNPYMLLMLTSVYADEGQLPDNRGQLFAKFVETLLEREAVPEAEQTLLIDGVAKVAYEMQIRRADADGINALTVLEQSEVNGILGERLLYLAGSASILSVSEQVRFTHQLLQEYFAAKYMDIEITAGRLKAESIWKPEKWWERTNWEEAVILLAGLYSDDCTPVVEWVNTANPEVAAQCVMRSGAKLADATREKLRDEWLSRLTDTRREPNPHASAAIGRALGLTDWDNRKGVNIIIRDGLKLPDIDWVAIPAGEFTYQDGKMTLDYDYQMARYLVTYAQYQTFIDDPEGYQDTKRWFDGLAADDDDKQMREQYFKYNNHPREAVNWYQATAFCRWLSWRLGGGYDLDAVDQWAVRLPTEFEWEKAARGNTGWVYPWGSDYHEGYANIDETKKNAGQYYLGQTSAAGIYPQGDTPNWDKPIADLCGNVLEWCLTDYENPQTVPRKETLSSSARRVARGGSWSLYQRFARAVYRGWGAPDARVRRIGFRLLYLPH